MQTVNAADLAKSLNLSKGRISQLAKEGRLDGCYIGDGRSRRYDPQKVALKLRGSLDQAQMLGNGAPTRLAIGQILSLDAETPAVAPKPVPKTDGALPPEDADSYEMRRKAKLAEEVRRLRRQNELDEGTLVLAGEVERQVARVLRQELAEIEEVLRTGARSVADKLGVDFRAVRQIMIDTWRAKRQDRSAVLATQAEAGQMTDAERDADI
jgi:ABC-type transporter Mla MlaB component